MNIYALFPLVAVIAYIPILVTALITRKPWQKRNVYFITFLIAAMLWSITDVLLRSTFFPEHKFLLFQFIVITFTLMAVQFHCFTSSFFDARYGRWLPFAYGSLVFIILLVIFGVTPQSVEVVGNITYLDYGVGVVFVAIPLLVLVVRNLYVFNKMLKSGTSAAVRSQIISLVIAIILLTVLTLFSILHPYGREIPISHWANLINALILTYAVVRHQLLDIKTVLREGVAWILLALIGVILYFGLLHGMNVILELGFTLQEYVIAALIAVIVAIVVYRVRIPFLRFMTRAFQGPSYDYRRRLSKFSDQIHNVFSLKEQGGELLSLLMGAINIKQACLMFPEMGADEFITKFASPYNDANDCADLRLRAGNPIIKYLQKEGKILLRESLSVMPAFLGMWPQEKEDLESRKISMFVPLISRERLIAIMVLGEKNSGRYTLEDFGIIEDVTSRVAVSMEKEYLREQLREREEELSVINNSSVILTSSLDIQEIFSNFLEELKKVIDISWASITMLEDEDLRCVAVSSMDIKSYRPGDTVPIEGTGTGWVLLQKKIFIEPDLHKDNSFESGEVFREAGLRTLVYLPLIAKGNAIGSFIVASQQPYAYSPRHIKLLEQIASQIALPLENAQLYARAEKRARVDELTGLLNRRSLDEMIDEEISRHSRYGGGFSLIIIDLDHFKSFNDCYGHLSGDNLLRDVGKTLKLAIRDSDRAFRYGGDEFAVLLPQTDRAAAEQVAERVRRRINALDTGELSIMASIGVSSWPDDGVSHVEIVATADESLYQAKRMGGNRVITPIKIKAAEEEGKETRSENNIVGEKINDIIFSLARTVDSRNRYNTNHSSRVAELSSILGEALGLTADDLKQIEIAAKLHDAGKIGISQAILDRQGSLSLDEELIMQSHPMLGAEIVANIPQIAICRTAILYHHERYDGNGYPEGLKEKEIPLFARILAIADEYVNLTSGRPGKKGLSEREAIEAMIIERGKKFDPELTDLFLKCIKGAKSAIQNLTRR